MKRPFTRFVGVDLGGGRGKTTAVAELRSGRAAAPRSSRSRPARASKPWTDDTLIDRLGGSRSPSVAIAIDAPLTQTACGRCERPVCPGMEACADPAVVWLRTDGRALIRKVAAETVGGRPAPRTSPPRRASPPTPIARPTS